MRKLSYREIEYLGGQGHTTNGRSTATILPYTIAICHAFAQHPYIILQSYPSNISIIVIFCFLSIPPCSVFSLINTIYYKRIFLSSALLLLLLFICWFYQLLFICWFYHRHRGLTWSSPSVHGLWKGLDPILIPSPIPSPFRQPLQYFDISLHLSILVKSRVLVCVCFFFYWDMIHIL